MVLGPRLDQRQSQSLVMTPQLQQAIKLLQLSNLELTAYVEAELEQNPLLEREEQEPVADPGVMIDGDGNHVEPDTQASGEASVDGEASSDGLDAMSFDETAPGDAQDQIDADIDNTFTNDGATDVPEPPAGSETLSLGSGSSSGGGGGGFDDDLPGLEQVLAQEVSLRDHLEQQIVMDFSDPVERLIARYLSDMLDESGYFRGELDTAALALGCDLDLVERVFSRVQEFDPSGIFARNLAECLELQLKDLNRFDPCMAALVSNLDLLAKRDLKGLLKVCGVDQADLADMINEIKALNPKPASVFDTDISQTVNPDVLMRARPGGGWHVELNPETLPRVLVNNQYYAEVSGLTSDKADRQYITEQFQSANWLVKSLHQRATTILKVATEIIRQQDAFFAKGVQYMKPLVLRDIADVIDMHESTVSRATSNKFISSPRGMFELKYFFTSAISSASGGDSHSAESVRYRIKTLIDDEPPRKILSDDKIVDLLRKDGIDIARRTVAKYREAMGIPSSVQRRREKAEMV